VNGSENAKLPGQCGAKLLFQAPRFRASVFWRRSIFESTKSAFGVRSALRGRIVCEPFPFRSVSEPDGPRKGLARNHRSLRLAALSRNGVCSRPILGAHDRCTLEVDCLRKDALPIDLRRRQAPV
jgi:hypothetical protein